jgi:antirestriction protein ArdC
MTAVAERLDTTTELDWAALIEVALSLPGSVGDTYNRFYDYSFMNQLLLMLQGVTEPVATYNKWLELGRQVRKGERAYVINRPIVVKRKQDEGSEEPTQTYRRFKLVKCLFTVSQTDGESLPEVQAKGWDLTTALKALDVKQVPYASIDGNVQGYSRAREYALNPTCVDPTHTTFHELAHIVLGHTTDAGIADYMRHRGQMEFQAEAVAYLVMNEVGQLSERAASHSRGYIQSWVRDERPDERTIRAIFTATDSILKAGRS